MKQNNAVEIAKKTLSYTDGNTPEETLLAQAVIDAESAIKHARMGEDFCLCLPRWLSKYAGDE